MALPAGGLRPLRRGGRELACVPGVATPEVVLMIWEAGDAARRMR